MVDTHPWKSLIELVDVLATTGGSELALNGGDGQVIKADHLAWPNIDQNHVYFAPISSMQWQTMQQWWGMVVGNTGGDKYETTAREIHLVLFSASGRVTFRKVTHTATKVNEKKFWQVPQLNWHVSSPIWVFFALSDPSCQWKIDSPKSFHAQRGRHSWLWFSQSSWLD